MKTTITYKGVLNGVHGVWCGECPDGVEVEKEITVYRPDDGKVFEKNGEIFDAVVLKPREKIESYKEIDSPKVKEDADKPEEIHE